MESDEPRGNPITTHLRTRSQTLFRVALALTALLALVVVATLPLAIRSMSSTLFAQERNFLILDLCLRNLCCLTPFAPPVLCSRRSSRHDERCANNRSYYQFHRVKMFLKA